MTTPDSNQNEPSRMKEFTSASVDESIHSQLPREQENDVYVETETVSPPPDAPPPPPVSDAYEPAPEPRRWKFLPAFWTVASALSLTVNIILIIIVLLMLQMLDQIRSLQSYGMGQASGVLGGLYNNFVKMDEAHIRKDIDINKDIRVKFDLNVSGPTNVTLTQPVTIRGATVSVQTGGLTITDANATIVLPAGQKLPINIENLLVPVDQQVPVVMKVPVDIALAKTDLHEPFVGLQEVVRPWYCLIQPTAMIGNRQVCGPGTVPTTLGPTPFDPTLLDPSLRTPAPAETVVP
jgi:hypothetical protein